MAWVVHKRWMVGECTSVWRAGHLLWAGEVAGSPDRPIVSANSLLELNANPDACRYSDAFRLFSIWLRLELGSRGRVRVGKEMQVGEAGTETRNEVGRAG